MSFSLLPLPTIMETQICPMIASTDINSGKLKFTVIFLIKLDTWEHNSDCQEADGKA